jgi:hypothetical protein
MPYETAGMIPVKEARGLAAVSCCNEGRSPLVYESAYSCADSVGVACRYRRRAERRCFNGEWLGRWRVAIAGIRLNAIGVFLMIRYGLPSGLPRLGAAATRGSKGTREDERECALGFVGVVLFVVGVLLQIVSVAQPLADALAM